MYIIIKYQISLIVQLIFLFNMIKLFLLALALTTLTAGSEIQRRQILGQKSEPFSGQKQYWFSQILDHYNYQSDSTWQQRYFVFDDHFDPTTGPVILYICGEAECRGISNISYTARIAEQTRGLVVSLQHRFYGKSLPFGEKSFTLQNLQLLTAEQALRDLAYFLTKMSKSGLYGITAKNPWITIGGSYPGAMAAWFRYKYPHLTIGSISSSGVILAVEDFKMFDEQIYLSAIKSGQFCVQAIIDTTDYVVNQVTGPKKDQFKAEYKAEKLSAEQFLFYWSDVIVFQVQYGNRVNFCNSLQNKQLSEQYEIIKALVMKVTPVDYGAYYLKNDSFAYEDGRGARSWIYQSCTEFSYFQTFSDQHPMRSRLLNLDFYKAWCQQIFGTWPFVDRVNTEFGGLNLNATNLIMTNGAEDPWQWASLQKSRNQIWSKIIECDNCAHCVDLHTPSEHDAQDLTDTRAYQLQSVKRWIANYWEGV